MHVFLVLLCLLGLSPALALAGRTFSGSGQGLTTAATIDATPPLTICVWARTADNTNLQFVAQQGTDTDQGFAIRFRGSDASDPFSFSSADGGSTSYATPAIGAYSINTWYHFCGNELATNSRAAWVNGGTKATDTATRAAHGAAIGASIGQRVDGNFRLNGTVAQVCLWNASLTDLEVAALAQGIACSKVRPDVLLSCPRLLLGTSPETDQCGARSWTLVGSPTVSTISPSLGLWTPQ